MDVARSPSRETVCEPRPLRSSTWRAFRSGVSHLLKAAFAASGERGHSSRSLRSELLFHLAFLAGAALVLALWTARLTRIWILPAPYSFLLLGTLVLLDVAVFVLLGNSLMQRLVVGPLSRMTADAGAIAAGDLERRVPVEGPREVRQLALSLNELTDQLVRDQRILTGNVQSLNETNRRLTEAQNELVQAEKMASLGRFAAGIAHEIGNPLGALIGYQEVIRRRGVSDPELLDGMRRESARIDRIVRSLLEYARPASATRDPVDVGASAASVVDLLRRQGGLAGIEVELSLCPRPLIVEAVAHRVDQIFVNLIRNAEAAMGGAGRLRIEMSGEVFRPADPVPVRRATDPVGVDYSHLRRTGVREGHRLAPGRPVVRIVVSDSGPGVPAGDAERIFDPFFTTRAPGEGTGLGLAIVAGTVHEIGGRIEVGRAELGGAAFSLLLPLAEATEER